MIKNTSVVALLVLSLTACNNEPPYECRIIPDRQSERNKMDDLVRSVHAMKGDKWEPHQELKNAREMQDRADDLIRKLNAEHGCPKTD